LHDRLGTPWWLQFQPEPDQRSAFLAQESGSPLQCASFELPTRQGYIRQQGSQFVHHQRRKYTFHPSSLRYVEGVAINDDMMNGPALPTSVRSAVKAKTIAYVALTRCRSHPMVYIGMDGERLHSGQQCVLTVHPLLEQRCVRRIGAFLSLSHMWPHTDRQEQHQKKSAGTMDTTVRHCR